MRLTDCFIELIAYVVYMLKTVSVRQPPFDQVKADIERLLSLSQECLGRGSISEEDYDLARFAIVAWIDEAILSSQWNEKNRWQSNPLQRVFYQTADAGEIFFERLNTIGPHQNDVREIYYLCLAMGFSGRYGDVGDRYLLEQVKASNLKLLNGTSVGLPSLEAGALFPEAYPVETGESVSKKTRQRFSMFYILGLGFPVVLYGILFMIYRFVLANIGKTFF